MEYLDKYNFSDNWFRKVRKSGKSNLQSLMTIKHQLIREYLTYDSLIINYQNNLNVSTCLMNKELLIDFYEHAPVKLADEFKNRRHYNELLECPYCGKPNLPNTLDHFIPKEKWPEFAIYPKNLVPQCRDCMSIKGKKYFCNINSMAKFVHPIYFDYLSQIKFEIKFDFCPITEMIINFRIKLIHPTNFTHLNRVKLHLKSLDVKKRIQSYCNEEFKKLERLRRQKRFSMATFLKSKLKSLHNDNIGKNWESSFYEALLNNTDCMNYFNNIRIIIRNQNNFIEISSDFE